MRMAQYIYDSFGRMHNIIYPDGKWKRYIYAKAQADFVLHKK